MRAWGSGFRISSFSGPTCFGAELHSITIRVVVKIRVPLLGTLNIRCRNITGTQKGTLILTTTHNKDANGMAIVAEALSTGTAI